MRKVTKFVVPLAAIAVLLVGWVHFRAASSLTEHANAAVERTASDDQIERQIADLLLASYQTGDAIDEDPKLWDLMSQLQPDQVVVLGD